MHLFVPLPNLKMSQPVLFGCPCRYCMFMTNMHCEQVNKNIKKLQQNKNLKGLELLAAVSLELLPLQEPHFTRTNSKGKTVTFKDC